MYRGYHNGEMSKMRKRRQEREEDLEDGWQTRQERQTDAINNRSVRVLRQDVQERSRKEENLKLVSHLPFFLVSTLAQKSVSHFPLFHLRR